MLNKSTGSTLVQLVVIIGLLIVIVGGIVIYGGRELFFGQIVNNKEYAPIVFDEANLLDEQTTRWLQTFSYPKGFIFIIRTIDTLPEKYIGLQADELFQSDQEKCPKPKECKKRGIYILISQAPKLVQIRTGSNFSPQVQWAGITAGSVYLEKQQAALKNNWKTTTPQIIEWLSAVLPNAVKIPWYKRFLLHDITGFFAKELEDLSLPSEGFYGTYLLKTFLTLRVYELQKYQSWWISFVLAAITARLIGFSITTFIKGGCRVMKISSEYTTGVIMIITAVIDLVIAVPSVASVIILSGARLEDQIALKTSGIPGIASLSFSGELFTVETGIEIALLIFLLRILKGFSSRIGFLPLVFASSEKQQQAYKMIEENNPLLAGLLVGMGTRDDSNHIIKITEGEFNGSPFSHAFWVPLIEDIKLSTRWGLLAWLSLPLGLSLATVYLWLVEIVIDPIVDYLTEKLVSSLLKIILLVILAVGMTMIGKQLMNNRDAGQPASSRSSQTSQQILPPTPIPSSIQQQQKTQGTLESTGQLHSQKIGIVSTQQDPLTIRSGAGTQYKRIGRAQKGEQLVIIEDTGAWYKVKLNDGTIGYANSAYIQVENSLIKKDSVVTPESQADLQLLFEIDKTTYRVGEKFFITIRTTQNCYLNVFDITTKGEFYQLLPSANQNLHFLQQGKVYTIPDARAKADWIVEEPTGTEYLFAVCTSKDVNILPQSIRNGEQLSVQEFERILTTGLRKVPSNGWSKVPIQFKVSMESNFVMNFSGIWKGTGHQYNNDSRWTIEMTIDSPQYSIAYPSLNCGGTLQLLSQSKSTIEFREKMTYGRSKCVDNGKIVISRIDSNTVKWQWYYSDGKLGSDSILTLSQ